MEAMGWCPLAATSSTSVHVSRQYGQVCPAPRGFGCSPPQGAGSDAGASFGMHSDARNLLVLLVPHTHTPDQTNYSISVLVVTRLTLSELFGLTTAPTALLSFCVVAQQLLVAESVIAGNLQEACSIAGLTYVRFANAASPDLYLPPRLLHSRETRGNRP
eukprot:4612204-Amphidinium_carterae.1